MDRIPGSPEWHALLARAKTALDDHGAEAYAKRTAAMERKWARLERDMGLKRPPYDFYMSREVMVEYDRSNRFRPSVEKLGAKENEVIESFAWDADLFIVRDFIKSRLRDRMSMKAADIAMDAQEELGRVVTGSSRVNPKGLALALEKTVPELYGDPDKRGAATQRGGNVTYNLPNLTLQLIATPRGLEQKAEDEAIEVRED